MVTPVERRTFVSVAPATTKSRLGPIFFQNIFVLHIMLVVFRVFVGFSSCFLLFHRQFVYDTDILKKKIGPSLLFLAARTTDTKFRRSTGVTTANSTNIRNTVELGDQLLGTLSTLSHFLIVHF